MKKIYYLLHLTQTSPLRLSSGFGENADTDLIKDSRGYPFIPGSSLAGVLRSLLPEQEGNRLFGKLEKDTAYESLIIVSDAVFTGNDHDFTLSVRDGVALTDEGTAKDTAKYDFEVLECTKPYIASLEVTVADSLETEILPILDHLFSAIRSEEGLRLGGRTTRGFGAMKVEVRQKVFTFPADLTTWLAWFPYDKNAWESCEPFELPEAGNSHTVAIHIDLMMQGSFTVRVSDKTDELDYSFLKSRNTASTEHLAAVPGTTWAGVFRHHMRNLVREMQMDDAVLAEIDSLFGVPKEGDKKDIRRSGITFSEMVVEGGNPYSQTRIAIDRFTMAPRNGALYKEKVYQGGHGTLTILISPSLLSPELRTLLSITLLDLDHGILHAGGEGSVGRGMAKVSRIRVGNKDVTEAFQNKSLILNDKEVV